jgi:hypothetical protein
VIVASLAEHLRAELTIWDKKSYSELLAIEYPHTYERGAHGEPDWYQVEAVLLERNDDYIHVSIAVDDGGLSTFFPKSYGVIAYADGRASN